MKVGIAGPVDMVLLGRFFEGALLPPVYSFPLISRMILELKKRGHEVTIFCASKAVLETQWIQGDGLMLCITPQRRKHAAYDFYRAERRYLIEAMNQSDCELIHAHWTYEFGAAATACNKPSLVTAHDASLSIWPFMLKRKIWLYWSLRILFGVKTAHKAEYLSAVSPYVARQIERWLYPKHRVLITPNGVTEELLVRPVPKVCVDSPWVICSVLTGWGQRKNPKAALRAFARVRVYYPSAEYRIFGNGYEVGGPAQVWAKRNGLDQGVEFCGEVPYEQLMPEIARSTIFLHPALEESFGMGVCEAMALGVPVVAGKKSGGVPFVLHEGAAGVLVDVKLPFAIAEGVLGLLRDENKRREFSTRGREFVSQNFTVSKMIDCYEFAYAAVLDGGWNQLFKNKELE